MTIIASVKVRDGLAMGTDSMTQIWGTVGGNRQLLKSYSNARKLFQLRDLPVGVMTYGLGNIGLRSIEGVVLDFCQGLDPGTKVVGDIADALFSHVNGLYNAEFAAVPPAQRQTVGFMVGGYSPGAPVADEYEFVVPTDQQVRMVGPQAQLGSSWRGINAPFSCLARGMAPAVAQELLNRGASQQDIDAVAAQAGMYVVFDGMPVQDAVNYAAYILDVTIGWATFQWGPATCARPLQMALIRPNTGWETIGDPGIRVPGT